MRSQIAAAVGAASLAALAAFIAPMQAAGRAYTGVDAKRLRAADSPENAGEWMSLDTITASSVTAPSNRSTPDSVSRLGLAWYRPISPSAAAAMKRHQSSWTAGFFPDQPLEQGLRVRRQERQAALEVRSEGCNKYAVKLLLGIVNRGVAVWKGKVIWGTLDGRLIAVDAGTGKKVWEVQATEPRERHSPSPARPPHRRWPHFHGRGRLRVRAARLSGCVRCREWEGAVALVVRARGVLPKLFEQPELKWAAKTWTGEWWKAGGSGPPGTPSTMTP